VPVVVRVRSTLLLKTRTTAAGGPSDLDTLRLVCAP
jgi:hypothetical protein